MATFTKAQRAKALITRKRNRRIRQRLIKEGKEIPDKYLSVAQRQQRAAEKNHTPKPTATFSLDAIPDDLPRKTYKKQNKVKPNSNAFVIEVLELVLRHLKKGD